MKTDVVLFLLLSLRVCDILLLFVADGSPESRLNVKFVQDTSKFWYKPEISREQGEMLKDCSLK